MTPEEIVERGERYARTSGYPIQYQVDAAFDGVNDSEAEIEGIVRLLSGKFALMNLIPTTATKASASAGRTGERAAAMVHAAPALHPDQGQLGRAGYRWRLRATAGARHENHATLSCAEQISPDRR